MPTPRRQNAPSRQSPVSSSQRSPSLVTLTLALVVLASFLTSGAEGAIATPLGKRITSMVAELGKRPKELYSFGIGEYVL